MCPKKCACEREQYVQCFRLESVPSDIAKDVKKLSLGYSLIRELKSRDFSGFTVLEDITMPSCGVELVETNAFKAQGLLRILELPNNKLNLVPHGLPHSLEVLKLGHNRIQSLQELSFEGLRNLRVLDLQNNQISILRASTLSSLVQLESLNLDSNSVVAAQGSLRLPQLNLLSLGNNRIPYLSSVFFTSLQSLAVLRLQGNLLTKVPHDLPQAVSSLNLDKNLIRALRSRELGHLQLLSVLSVSHNRLASVDGGLRLPNLTALELCGNQLRTLPSRLGPGLQRLDCRQNAIKEVTLQQLSGMRQLRHLFLENNTIRHFEASALNNCVHLINLALEQNLLSTIPEGLPDSLVRLDLKGNRIETIHEQQLRPLKRLQVLNLRNNRLSSLGFPAMELLPRLRKVYLDGNPWNCSCELLRVKRRLLTRKVEIRSELCNEPVGQLGNNWRAYLKAQDSCEDFNQKTTTEIKGKSPVHTDQTDNEEYYDYD